MKNLCLAVKVSHGTRLNKAIKDAVKLRKELDLNSISFVFNEVDIEISSDPAKADFINKFFKEHGISTIMYRLKKREQWISI